MDRATRTLLVLLAIAVAVSVVHYVDNVVNYEDYPQPGPGDLPAPSAPTIAVAWFVFTASGALAVWFWLRRRVTAAAVALTAYSVSGLIGLGHYTAPGAPRWCGGGRRTWWPTSPAVAIFGFALWAAFSRGRSAPPRAA